MTPSNSFRFAVAHLPALLIGASLSAQSIAYNTVGAGALSAAATFEQTGCPATATINGLVTGGPITGGGFDAWSVSPNYNQQQSILWVFNGGPRLVSHLQILTYYYQSGTAGYHRISNFQLDYTTAPLPSVAATNFMPLQVVTMTGAASTITGNRVVVAAPGGDDYRISFSPVVATGIRLTNAPNSGISLNGNYIISEVSFETKPPPVIAYNTIGASALSAAATFEQTGCPATATINGFVAGGPIPGGFDAWAVSPNHNQQQSILWVFNGGPRLVSHLQILTYYYQSGTAGYHRISNFQLEYTTSPSPSVSAIGFIPVQGVSMTGAASTITGNRVVVAMPGADDYRISFTPVVATGIRLTNAPFSGISINGNYIISEVSFETASVGYFTTTGPGCLGSRGIPTLAGANGSVPAPGQVFTMVMTNLPVPTSSTYLALGSSPLIPSFNLWPMGAPGCMLHVNPETFLPITNFIGFGSLAAQLPNTPSASFYAQAVVFDSQANALGVALSNACAGGW